MTIDNFLYGQLRIKIIYKLGIHGLSVFLFPRVFFLCFFFCKYSLQFSRIGQRGWSLWRQDELQTSRGSCHFFEHEQEEVEWPYGSRRTGQIFEQTLGKRSTLLWLVNAARRFKETRFNHLLCDSRFLISFVRENCLREKNGCALILNFEQKK